MQGLGACRCPVAKEQPEMQPFVQMWDSADSRHQSSITVLGIHMWQQCSAGLAWGSRFWPHLWSRPAWACDTADYAGLMQFGQMLHAMLGLGCELCKECMPHHKGQAQSSMRHRGNAARDEPGCTCP